MTTMSELYFLHPTGEVCKVVIYTIDVKIEFMFIFSAFLADSDITPSDFGKFFA